MPDILPVVADILTQLPAILGVIVGSIGTIFATTFAERSRWRREQNVRWDERRLSAYVEFGKSLKEIRHLCGRLTAKRRPTKLAVPIDRQEGVELLNRAQANRTKAWEEVLLLGDTTTIVAGKQWREAVFELERLAVGDGEIAEDWDSATRLVDDARDNFYRTARSSLAVRGTVASVVYGPPHQRDGARSPAP